MLTEKEEQVNSVFNKLRARLYSLIEATLPDETQQVAVKRFIRDFTGTAWNDATKIVVEE